MLYADFEYIVLPQDNGKDNGKENPRESSQTNLYWQYLEALTFFQILHKVS